MSDHIPFDIQSEIIRNLHVKSLLRFRSVSKQWKSLIDCLEFIKNYRINRTNPQQHLLVLGNKLDTVPIYTSIIDDKTFPQRKFPLTVPESLKSLRHTSRLMSVNGLFCFYGYYGDAGINVMAVLWNPSIRKSVSIVIPNVIYSTVIGFGVCSEDTSDPKIVKINLNTIKKPYTWVVEVFTLSTRAWKTVYMGAPKSCETMWDPVYIDGSIYWRTVWDKGSWCNNIISFDLKREKFGEVFLQERLSRAYIAEVAKVKESLGMLEYYIEGEIWFCGVWTMKDGVNKPFTKIYTVKVEVEGKSGLYSVLGFRNNGEVVVAMQDDNDKGYVVEVYEPSSRHINGVGIKGKCDGFSVTSYTETLLLLQESDSIIH